MQVRYGYQAPFILCVALTGVDLLLRLFLLERRNRPKEWFDESSGSSVTVSDVNSSTSKPSAKKVSTMRLLRLPRLWANLVISFAMGVVFNVFEPTLTVRLSTEFGYNSSQIGLVFLAQVIPTFVATPLAGYFSDKYGSKIVCLSTTLLCVVMVALMGIPNANTPGGIVPLIIIFAIQGFSSFAFITPVLPDLANVVQQQNPDGGDDGQGRSYAFFNMAFASGALVGPIIGGYMYASIGFFWMCITIAAVLLICTPPIYLYMGEPGKLIVRQRKAETPVTDGPCADVAPQTETAAAEK
ncbi:hypothetical protein EC973_002656 [Apophysomyces ossiformis]|uniref:Major facilitator superfamily (MFS) profile domain-containing protein n=1 Tax=Apophysomyces ossiformis TaxID=679940 RepID=A0A8H7BI34_9FUNG|nr:hypothetical protein EC973_002656 [Apophysomyces ossiformis]